MTDGRSHRPEKVALWDAEGTVRSPAVGRWRNPPPPGRLVRPGDEIGELEVLGILIRLVAPAGAVGVVVEDDRPAVAPIAVDYGARLFALDREALTGAAVATSPDDEARAHGNLVFCTPISGRFYNRPSPDKPPFVAVGDEITQGQTVALLEVMKTFNRLSYGGEDLPARARIKAIVPDNEADLDQGAVILELEV